MKEKQQVTKTESVKIKRAVVAQVREYVKTTRQSIGGFFSLAASEKIKKGK